MNDFSFVGKLPASKSLLNRCLIVQSYFPELQIEGRSECDDVTYMKKALKHLSQNKPIDCGEAGTVLRFVALRALREKGQHQLIGKERLFSRPQESLLKLISKLGGEFKQDHQQLNLRSWGWKVMGDALHIETLKSSQFASAVLLNAWNLKEPLHIRLAQERSSEAYFEMTVSLLKKLGMEIYVNGNECSIPPEQKLSVDKIAVEQDLSSAFAVAAIATISGKAKITDFPYESLQPDFVFIEILQKMGAHINYKFDLIRINRPRQLFGIEVDLNNSPDLFPILCALAALAEGPSYLLGAPQLKYKESNRLEKCSELLTKIMRPFERRDDGLVIKDSIFKPQTRAFDFDPDQDHRMAMAAGVLKKAGYKINILNPDVVNKSFPEFWSILGVPP